MGIVMMRREFGVRGVRVVLGGGGEVVGGNMVGKVKRWGEMIGI